MILLVLLTALNAPAAGNVRVAFDSTSLDFGSVAVFGSRDLVIELWDTAAVPIKINQLSIGGLEPGDFSVVAPTSAVVLSPGSVHTKIIVQFSPQLFGSHSALLVIATSDGTVNIPLTGFGAGGPELTWSATNIDFGMIAPGGERDTVIELRSSGADTAIISYLDVGGSDTSFKANFLNGIQTPVTLAPGDSIAVQIAFRGLPLLGIKNAQLTIVGNMQNNPNCDLSGDDELGSFAVLPSPDIDFGVMYAGQVFDSTILLINSSTVDLTFDDMSLSPSGVDFTILNPPILPFTLGVGDTLFVAIRANPGIATSHFAQLQLVSQQALPNFETDRLTVSVIPPSVIAPVQQSLSYFCATSAPIADTIPISNTGLGRVVITGVMTNHSGIALQSSVSFPDTLLPGSTRPIILQFTPSSPTTDTLIVWMIGGEQVMLADTLTLHPLPTQAATSVAATAVSGTAPQHIVVSAVNGIAAFDLDSIIVHVSVQDPNVVTIDPSTFALASALTNASIVSTLPETGGYAVTITSTSPITVTAGSQIVTMDLNRYVSKSDATDVIAAIETPELTGCLFWTADTVNVSGLTTCGSAALGKILSGGLPSMIAVLHNNPVQGQIADLSVTCFAASDVRYTLINALGQVCAEGSLHIVTGENDCTISTSAIPSGIYTLRLISAAGYATALRFVKTD